MWLFILLAISSPPLISGTPTIDGAQHVLVSNTTDNKTILVKAGTLLSLDFDLSGLRITSIKADALSDLTCVTSLNLSNNLLEAFNLSLLSGMKKLERLSLSHNRLTYLTGNALELHHLKVIDLSHNNFEVITEVDLRYLPKSVELLVEGNEGLKLFSDRKNLPNDMHYSKSYSMHRRGIKTYESRRGQYLYHTFEPYGPDDLVLCKTSGTVEFVAILADDNADLGCSWIRSGSWGGAIRIGGRYIKKFKARWLRSYTIVHKIDLSNNEISEITPELLNDLPSMIDMVDLNNNPISIIKKTAIDNRSLKSLILTVEGGSGIENGVFEKTSLERLVMTSRGDLDVNFIKTLPTSLKRLFLESCKFVPFDENILSNLKSLEVVALRGCSFRNLPVGLFAGLEKLKTIFLPDNSIENIEVGTFDDNVNVGEIFLSRNKIKILPGGLFSFNPNLVELYVDDNEVTKILRTTFSGRRNSQMGTISFENNKIREIEKSAFFEVRVNYIDLRGNFIETVKKGTFRNSTIYTMGLENNLLGSIDEGFFDSSKITWLYLDNNPVKTLKKNAFKNVTAIFLSEIENIESGALYGSKAVKFDSRRLKKIPGDIFKDD